MLKLRKVSVPELFEEEKQLLMDAQGVLVGKKAQTRAVFSRMLQNIYNQSWPIYRMSGGAKGLVVLEPQEDKLNIFYLNGSGMFGKVSELAQRLMDIAEDLGLPRTLCLVTSDERKARLFAQTPGTTREWDGEVWYLELRDGRQ